jgi:adenylate cyclase
MTPIKLKRLLGRQSPNHALIDQLAPGVSITDAAGMLLHGALENGVRFPVQVSDTLIGWVSGSKQPELVAHLLIVLAQQEIEKAELADATLDLYREINLLYELADKLAVSLEIDVITHVIVAEVKRVIAVDHVAILLSDRNSHIRIVPTMVDLPVLPDPILGELLQQNKAEIVGDVSADPRWAQVAGVLGSLAYTPLKSKERVLGVIVLMTDHPAIYRAADLKILNTIASQAAPTIDNALLYEQTTHDAIDREARLQQQIRELRIEIDQQHQQQQVSEITDTDYFRAIREQREGLRMLLDKPDE